VDPESKNGSNNGKAMWVNKPFTGFQDVPEQKSAFRNFYQIKLENPLNKKDEQEGFLDKNKRKGKNFLLGPFKTQLKFKK